MQTPDNLNHYLNQLEELRIIQEAENFKICRCIYNNRYLCCSNGVIFDTIKNKIIKPTINPLTSYAACWLYVGNKKKYLYVHRVIFFSFNNIKILPKNYNVDHLNGIRDDNRLINLQLLTHQENIIKSKNNPNKQYKEIDKRAYLKAKQRKIIKQQLLKLNEEIKILIMLFHIDSFYTFNRHIIFNSIVDVLRNIVLNAEKLTHSNFFKYCDILDFILAKNPDISFPEIIEYISANKIQKQRISKKFKLSQYYLNH